VGTAGKVRILAGNAKQSRAIARLLKLRHELAENAEPNMAKSKYHVWWILLW
jgi:hypothetical protein